jgi:hypothetical protein
MEEQKFDLLKALVSTRTPRAAEITPYLEDIRTALDQGYSKKAIWQVLHENNQITCTYQYFSTVIRTKFKTDTEKKPPESTLGRKFKFTNKPNPDDLI